MSNPLISGPVETSSAFAGLGIIESGEALCLSIQSGSWVEGGIAAFSLAMDAVGMVIDPIGSLIAMGLGWLIENLEPLKGWMNAVTGNADEVAGFAQTWTNIAAHLKATGEELIDSMRRVEGLSGQTLSAYRALNGDAAAHIEASGRWAEGIAAGMQIASMIVGMVHDITRDAISMVVGTAISAAVTTVATVGFGAPVAAAQVATKVAQLAGKIGKFITRLVRSLSQLSDLVKKLTQLFEGAGSGFRNAVPDAPTLPTRPLTGGSGDQYSVAFQMRLDPSDWAQRRPVHNNRANAALDEALQSDPEYAAAMEAMSPGISDRVTSVGGRQNPNPEDFIWNHAHPETVGGEHGIMQLVPTYQHTPGSPFWATIHPGNRGGFAIWGGKR